jgi:hypothetical protein
MAQRVVKLKPDKPAPGPAVRLRRFKPGTGETYPFVVGCLDEKGCEDFRGMEEFQDYDSALKAASALSRKLRLPVEYGKGLEPETKVAASADSKPSHKSAGPVPSVPATTSRSDELPTLASLFKLPAPAVERVGQVEAELIVKRASALHREARDEYLRTHAQVYGGSRDRACTYTQKTHDQIQGQIASLYDHCLAVQTILYGYLEAAFKRVEELERKCLTTDSFDAQVADDDRTIELAFGSGEQRQVASFKWPTVLYRGTHKAGQQYEAGDMVSHQGSGWIAQRATSATPGTPNSGFQLAIKRGKDGK